MRAKLYGNVCVVIKQLRELVESLARVARKLRTVELIKNIPYEHRGIDRRQGEINGVARGNLRRVYGKLLLVVQKAVARGKEHILNPGLHHLLKAAVAFQPELHVGPVVAYHIHGGLRKFVAVLLVNPAGNGVHHFGTLERVNMIPTAPVLAVAAEKATVVNALESHSEVVARRVDRRRQYLNAPCVVYRVGMCAIYVETSHAGVSVRGEIHIAVEAERGEHLIARGVHRLAKIFYHPYSVGIELRPPNVETAHAARHIRHKVKPPAVGRYGGVGV